MAVEMLDFNHNGYSDHNNLIVTDSIIHPF
jgi:hypothetical protein